MGEGLGRRGSAIATAWLLALSPATAFATGAAAGSLRASALERLAPGVRPESERAGVEVVSATYGDRLVERVYRPGEGPSAARDWLEVEYTMDPRLEARVRGVLERQAVTLAHVILMDPRSGEIFAYVSTDPERFPATRAYPTASLMKIVTAAALLRHAPEATRRPCRWIGSPYRLRGEELGGGGHVPLAAREDPRHRPGWIGSFRSALATSNNQCFARFAMRDLGEEPLRAELARTGLLEPPAFRHPPGRLDAIEEPVDLANLGSGLGGSAITPLAAARLAALLATGEAVEPRWIAQVRDRQGLALGGEPADPQRVWEEGLAETLRDLLVSVTETGTASRAFHDAQGTPRLGPVRVAGKTGTLHGDEPGGLYQWFAGVAPAESPSLAIAAVVVHTGPERGASASTIAAATLEQVFCDGGAGCAAERADTLRARAAGRTAQVERGRREAVAAAHEVELPLDEPPRRLDDVPLRLPKELLRQKREGEVALQVQLDPRGHVKAIAVAASDLPPEFDAFLVEAVRGWRFTPPTRAGRPATAMVRLPIPIRVD